MYWRYAILRVDLLLSFPGDEDRGKFRDGGGTRSRSIPFGIIWSISHSIHSCCLINLWLCRCWAISKWAISKLLLILAHLVQPTGSLRTADKFFSSYQHSYIVSYSSPVPLVSTPHILHKVRSLHISGYSFTVLTTCHQLTRRYPLPHPPTFHLCILSLLP